MRNIKAVVEYDGTEYHGFQIQTNQGLPTIQGKLESCLMRVLKEPIKVTGAGRTDAGVHAEGQVINFFTNSNIPLDKFPLAINSKLPSDIVIKSVEEAEVNFHAQYDAKGKHYIYRIYNNRIPSVFTRRFAYFVPYKIDTDLINKGCELFIGTHNFKSFAASSTTVKSFVRTIYCCEFIKQNKLWEFHIQGSGFLHNMVRIMVGTLLELGKGKRNLQTITEALANRNRILAGQTAPAHGLSLKKVFYS